MDDLKIIFEDVPAKIIVSKPPVGSEFFKIRISRTDRGFLLEKFTQKQAFHENLSPEDTEKRCGDLLSEGWRQLNAWGSSYEFEISVSKKGKVLFNKRKISQN